MHYTNKIKITIKICPECLGDDVVVSERWEDLPIRDDWTPVSFWLPLIECNDCRKTLPAIESRKAIHDASCLAMGALPPPEIMAIRKAYNLNAEQFSQILGLELSTVNQWESRSLFPTKGDMARVNLFSRP